MPIPCYLALTGAEFANIRPLPKKIAWMACHFSCYATGLSNLPKTLPRGSVIIVNDRTPPDRHDPQRILEQLQALSEVCKPDGFLLDLQRSGIRLNQQIAQLLTEQLPCPVGVTAEYAVDLCCPVFLEPPPLHVPLEEYIASWKGRDIWLELAMETAKYTVTAQDCQIEPEENEPLPEPFFTEDSLFCRYHTELLEDKAVFTLQRTQKELEALLLSPSDITCAIGLWQQLGSAFCSNDLL